MRFIPLTTTTKRKATLAATAKVMRFKKVNATRLAGRPLSREKMACTDNY
jgi:hypothetical protein